MGRLFAASGAPGAALGRICPPCPTPELALAGEGPHRRHRPRRSLVSTGDPTLASDCSAKTTRYGLCSYGLSRYGVYSYGLYSYGVYSYGLFNNNSTTSIVRARTIRLDSSFFLPASNVCLQHLKIDCQCTQKTAGLVVCVLRTALASCTCHNNQASACNISIIEQLMEGSHEKRP